MSSPIYMRIGSSDSITLPAFIKGLRNFLGLLQDVDSTLAQNRKGSVIWEVSALEKNSPPIIGVVPRRLSTARDMSEQVEREVIKNARMLTERGTRTQYISDSALGRIEHLASLSRTLGESSIFMKSEGRVSVETTVNVETLRNVQEMTGIKYTAFGTIVGTLEAISVHRGNEFRIWDLATKRPIRCTFDSTYEGRVKDLLRAKVFVTGMVNFNRSGAPVLMEAEHVERKTEHDLPSVKQMSGLIDDFTGGQTLREYLSDIADD